MLLTEMFIKEQGEDAAIIFGRFNPPHQGHVAAWREAAKFPIWYVGTNKSTQGPKDPLPFDVKIKIMEALYPEIKGHLVAEKTWFTLAAMVYAKHGAVTLHIVTDEQDSATYVAMLKKQNGVEGQHGFYNFKNIVWQPAPRLSSATDLRAAVAANDPTAFSKAAGVPADTKIDGEPFFNLVKFYLDAQAKPVKKVTEQENTTIQWNELGEEISVEDKMSIIELHYTKGNLLESNSEGTGNYFQSLFTQSDNPKENNKYIVVALALINDKIVSLNKPAYMNFISKTPNGVIFELDNKQITYPPTAIKDNSIWHTFTFNNVDKYDQFRSMLYLKFDTALPEIRLDEMGGVGVVANNAKQAKDPRYIMSMTADVKPGETQRQAKKMGFKLDKKGMPPLAHSTAAKNTSPNKAYNLGLTESKSFKLKK